MKKGSKFITEEFLEEKLEEKILGLRENLREEISIMQDHLDDKNRKYKDEVLTGLDKVMKELSDMREENAAGTLQLRRLTIQGEDHEKRITNLESAA